MKYIMIEREMNAGIKERIPVIFPKSLVHAEVASSIIECIKVHHGNCKAEVVSAGEVLFQGTKVTGGSDTLKLTSDPGDALIIQFIDYFNITNI